MKFLMSRVYFVGMMLITLFVGIISPEKAIDSMKKGLDKTQ